MKKCKGPASMKKCKGVLPNTWWLIQHGLAGLYVAIKKRPDLFAHLARDYRGGMTDVEAIGVAELLAKENDGVVPARVWLMANNYSALADRLYRCPNLFSHLHCGCLAGQTDDDAIGLAETLARQNSGIVPNQRWLNQNGHQGLAYRLRRKPHLFSHLKQNRRQKTDEQMVTLAEKLTSRHGAIPNIGWLNSHNLTGLARRICKKPQLFSHLKRRRLDTHGRPI